MLFKLTAQCSQAEYCTYDIIRKLINWGAEEKVRGQIVRHLIENRYVDDTRFCRAFIDHKLRFNRWGKRKIEQALCQKHISKDIYSPLLETSDTDAQQETLLALLLTKLPTIKATTDYERRGKLVRFALQRGFEMGMIYACLDRMNLRGDDYGD